MGEDASRYVASIAEHRWEHLSSLWLVVVGGNAASRQKS